MEEGCLAGGVGSAVAEFLSGSGIDIELRHIGIPDQFIHHGSQSQNRKAAGLASADIIRAAAPPVTSEEPLTQVK